MLSDLNEGLLNAIDGGQVEVVRELLAAGANPNFLHKHGAPALSCAASKGDPQMVELLLRAGARIHGRNYFFGTTALQSAAVMQHLDVVDILLEAGADINEGGLIGTALSRAVSYGRTALSLSLLARDADVRADPGSDLLSSAVAYNDTVLFNALLNAGAPLLTSAAGETALTLAANRRHDAFVLPLIRAGADVNARTNDGWTALTLHVGGRRHMLPPSVPTIIHLLAAGARADAGPGEARVDDLRARQGTTVMLREVPDADRQG